MCLSWCSYALTHIIIGVMRNLFNRIKSKENTNHSLYLEKNYLKKLNRLYNNTKNEQKI